MKISPAIRVSTQTRRNRSKGGRKAALVSKARRAAGLVAPAALPTLSFAEILANVRRVAIARGAPTEAPARMIQLIEGSEKNLTPALSRGEREKGGGGAP